MKGLKSLGEGISNAAKSVVSGAKKTIESGMQKAKGAADRFQSSVSKTYADVEKQVSSFTQGAINTTEKLSRQHDKANKTRLKLVGSLLPTSCSDAHPTYPKGTFPDQWDNFLEKMNATKSEIKSVKKAAEDGTIKEYDRQQLIKKKEAQKANMSDSEKEAYRKAEAEQKKWKEMGERWRDKNL